MKVNYKGMSKDYNFRVAEINYDEEENEKVEEMIEIMHDKGWDIINGVAGWANCEMDNIEQYRNFMKDWKEAKKELKRK